MSPAAKGSGPNTLGRWGEWKWLSALLPGLSRGLSRRVVLGPGDDAALLNLGGETWAITTDMLVEGVHFRTSWTSGEELGHKALAVNLSDLAAMGDVTPGFGVVSAGFPPQTPVSFLKGFYRGFAALARSTGFDLVGGDTVRADRITVSVTALGKVRPGNRVFRRDAFHPGDV
ncbi:MAG TPA: thiamine-phosphate kinase, partial [Elusimicrobiota bacterium]|nr:thiamine-phosphate kinase [Elusimicrobiota bacterium]